MHAQAAAIRAGIRTGDLVELPASTSLEEQEAAKEGRILVLRHLRRERSSSLRAEKIKKVLVRCGRLECEVCNFDFEKVYGDRGIGFAEIHHLTPLHVTGPVETTTSDLAVLCANCHRMIHRGSQWLGPAELRDLILARLG
jgi:5-methylcytosine-specific restriction protein A